MFSFSGYNINRKNSKTLIIRVYRLILHKKLDTFMDQKMKIPWLSHLI